jgi:cytochrome c oxidase cbb3-type subunit II
VVEGSIMPAYPWLFEWKDEIGDEDKVVNVPDHFASANSGNLVAKKEAIQLVAYLQSLTQTPLPDGAPATPFIYESVEEKNGAAAGEGREGELDGAQLYSNNCQACHQANGEGLKGAFPPLKSSAIVLDDNPEILVEIIMKGYNGREEYGEMPAVGTNNGLKPEEITAIINHERSSWGNQARSVSLEEVEKIVKYLQSQKTLQ